MFTGLIEETGTIAGIKKQNNGAVITINCAKILEDLQLGDSIAVDGACQTATKITNSGFEVEASEETLGLTTLNTYKQGQLVNLERAMPANGRFGGHIVTGHVEGIGEFLRKENKGLSYNFYFSAPDNIAKYLIYKGSVTINGISLTIASLSGNIFSVAVIPVTLRETNLCALNVGDRVNLEPDILAKYVEKFTQRNSNSNITENFLAEHGFM